MIEHVHIHSAFDADLENIQSLILQMGGLAERQIEDSTTALHQRDQERAQRVIVGDRRIDALEQEIDADVVRVLALRQPQAQDLRAVVTVMKTAGNLERIGDYAKNIAKRTSVLAQSKPIGSSTSTLKRQSRAVQDMLRDVLDAYVKKDADLAEDVRQRDEEVDQIYNALFRELLTHMMEDARNITACMHLLFIAKNMERMGDHITSIAEQVIYMVTGALPEDARPKGDTTSSYNAGMVARAADGKT
jgi:phosphate transport system protein